MTIRQVFAGTVVAAVIVGGLVSGASAGPQPGGVTRRDVAVSRSASTPQRHSVLRLYRAYFLRAPEKAGYDHWADQFSSGRMSLASISQFFSESSEFKNTYGSLSNTAFVGLIYTNVLGRTPDNAGSSYWITTLDRGRSRGTVMIGFSESSEFQRKTGTVPPTAPPTTTVPVPPTNCTRDCGVTSI